MDAAAPSQRGSVAEVFTVRAVFESAVLAFACGIAAYFAWPSEPKGLWVGLTCIFAIATSIVARGVWSSVSILFLLSCLGFAWSTLHAGLVSPNPMVAEQRLEVTGWVSAIDDVGRMRRLTIDVVSATPTPRSGLPKRVRIRVGKAFTPVDVGDGLNVEAVIGPLPGPAIPDGYDPGRRAFYDGLAGSGFAITPGRLVEVELGLSNRFQVGVSKVRRAIVTRVLAAAPEDTSGLQAALLTGVRDHIPDDQTEHLRASGLAHVLAISGLHMGMVAFGIYAAVGLALASVERLARAQDVRKIAAMVGLVAGTAYLLLSGASVATQRAYIMVSIAFLAIMFDRRAISIRSVMVAALVTLTLRPEALVSVGFQMSFAAVTAMVVIFRAWQDRFPVERTRHWRDRVKTFYGSLFGTSFVAGFATGIFALLHFGRFANYGLIANMAAMSIFPLVMGAGVLALLLMPLGLEALPLWVMGSLLDVMLRVAEYVSELPGAVGTVKASQPWVIALYGLGFALACLGGRRGLAVGTLAMIVAVTGWARSPVWDVRIDSKGRVSVLSEAQAATTSLRADRYGRDQFARASGEPNRDWSSYRDALASCDVMGCRMELGETRMTVIEEPSEVVDACTTSDIVVLAARDAGPVARRGCNALLLDQRALRQTGGIHLMSGRAESFKPIRSEKRARRIWGGGAP
ncbi:MAG: ComEC/Rec2 family competence protein [Litorimonas sp.]